MVERDRMLAEVEMKKQQRAESVRLRIERRHRAERRALRRLDQGDVSAEVGQHPAAELAGDTFAQIENAKSCERIPHAARPLDVVVRAFVPDPACDFQLVARTTAGQAKHDNGRALWALHHQGIGAEITRVTRTSMTANKDEGSTPIYEVHGTRATIRLNRPRHHNRLQPEDLVELMVLFDQVEADPA